IRQLDDLPRLLCITPESPSFLTLRHNRLIWRGLSPSTTAAFFCVVCLRRICRIMNSRLRSPTVIKRLSPFTMRLLPETQYYPTQGDISILVKGDIIILVLHKRCNHKTPRSPSFTK